MSNHAPSPRRPRRLARWLALPVVLGLSVTLACAAWSVAGEVELEDELTPTPPGFTHVPDTADKPGAHPRVTQVAAGLKHTCALLETGAVRCWGDNLYGQLGVGNNVTIGDDETPAHGEDVKLGGRATMISAGDTHTCALLEGGRVRCWGSNDRGQLGYPRPRGGPKRPLPGEECLNQGWCVGFDNTPADAGDVAVGGTVIDISAGRHHACAILQGGDVRCWGGRMGRTNGVAGRFDNPATYVAPVDLAPVPLGARAVAIDSGPNAACALTETGGVRCWGSAYMNRNVLGYPAGPRKGVNDFREFFIGDDETPAEMGDVHVGGPARAVHVSSGDTCVVTRSGGVRCWGGAGDAPGERIDVGGRVTALAGGTHTCALYETGDVRCWGVGIEGKLGLGTTEGCPNKPPFPRHCRIGDDETPASVAPIQLGGRAVAITAHGSHTCALMEKGTVRCWGSGRDGRLGYGNTDTIGDDETPASVGDVPLFNPNPRPGEAPAPARAGDPLVCRSAPVPPMKQTDMARLVSSMGTRDRAGLQAIARALTPGTKLITSFHDTGPTRVIRVNRARLIQRGASAVIELERDVLFAATPGQRLSIGTAVCGGTRWDWCSGQTETCPSEREVLDVRHSYRLNPDGTATPLSGRGQDLRLSPADMTVIRGCAPSVSGPPPDPPASVTHPDAPLPPVFMVEEYSEVWDRSRDDIRAVHGRAALGICGERLATTRACVTVRPTHGRSERHLEVGTGCDTPFLLTGVPGLQAGAAVVTSTLTGVPLESRPMTIKLGGREIEIWAKGTGRERRLVVGSRKGAPVLPNGTIRWAGDLNGDGELDIFLLPRQCPMGPTLYLSQPGGRLVEVARMPLPCTRAM